MISRLTQDMGERPFSSQRCVPLAANTGSHPAPGAASPRSIRRRRVRGRAWAGSTRLPRVTAGYSGTALARKLGIKQGHLVVLLDAPEGWSVPDIDSVELRRDLRKRPDVIVAFVRSLADLRRRSRRLVAALPRGSSLWIAWPRKAGGHVSDVTEQSLRDELLPMGVVDVKVAALDEDWSGLRFTWRRM